MERFRSLLAWGTFLSSVGAACFATNAWANGRFPSANAIVVDPARPERIVLRATFGLVFTQDGGKSWDWVCERAVGYGGVEDPPLGILEDGTLVGALFAGLSLSHDWGCQWQFAGGPLEKRIFVDVAVGLTDRKLAVAVSNQYAGATDAGSRFDTRVFFTEDGALTWRALGAPIDPSLVVETIDIVPSDPNRLYVSAIRTRGDKNTGVFLASRDRGTHWKETIVPLRGPDERAPYIAAVDPVKADRVYVRTAGPTRSRLLVTDDGGKTFRSVHESNPILGFALSADGKKVFVGSREDGLWMADRDKLEFTQRSPVPIHCLANAGNKLYACSNGITSFLAGVSNDDGATFDTLLRLKTMRGPLACNVANTNATCTREWQELRSTLGLGSGDSADAGSVDASPPAESKPTRAASGGRCGCRTVGSGSEAAMPTVGGPLLTLIVLRLRRKKELRARSRCP